MTLTIVIEGHGHGIPAADLERAFEKSARMRPGDGRQAGTGLGLAIGKGVAEAMGGAIHAESPVRNGDGTRMVIHRPAGKPAEPAIEQEPAGAAVALHSGR